MMRRLLGLLLFCACWNASAQDISLYAQHNGRYDFVFVGNTMNPGENNSNTFCYALTSSAAVFSLAPDQEIVAAYLYWAGSGPGDFEVQLNGVGVNATRTFTLTHWLSGFKYFSAFADVTEQVQLTGNGTYTLSDLDVNPWLSSSEYCNNRTNFAGWSLVVIYKDEDLPLNQLNVYDGLQGVPLEISIQLENLNVIDNVGAKIGFIAWEGDAGLGINEQLTINDIVLGNPPLNQPDNAFNGTNSFTGSNQLYNMDLDFYNIQNTIAIGDTQAEIQLTSGMEINGVVQGDFVMISTVITKLNSQVPDATVIATVSEPECFSRELTLEYTVGNYNATDFLPAGTPVSIYAGDVLLTTVYTQADIPVDASESGSVTITIPQGVPNDFQITLVADDPAQVTEIVETNNTFTLDAHLFPMPDFNPPPPLIACNEGLTRGTFDLSPLLDAVPTHDGQEVTFYLSELDAMNATDPILDYTNFEADATPMLLWFRVQDDPCFNVGSVELRVRNCPPTPYNFISVNGDGRNDVLTITGLYDIFLNFDLMIYNRWGTMVWRGGNNSGKWDGQVNQGIKTGNDMVPDGTYYYILYLNDSDYPEPLNGFLYLTH